MLDPNDFITAMRKAPTAVSIVTTDGAIGPYGATVSAVCSLSASPPAVLICLNRKSRILGMIEEHGAFCVNYVSEGQDDIALAFAGVPGNEGKRIFNSENWTSDPASHLPVLQSSSAVFNCLHIQTVPFGSHRILIGKVEQASSTENVPLAYWDGSFRQVTDQR